MAFLSKRDNFQGKESYVVIQPFPNRNMVTGHVIDFVGDVCSCFINLSDDTNKSNLKIVLKLWIS